RRLDVFMANTDSACPEAIVKQLLKLYPPDMGTATLLGPKSGGLSGAAVRLVHIKRSREDRLKQPDALRGEADPPKGYDGLAFAKIDRADRCLEDYRRHNLALTDTECTNSFIPGIISPLLGPIENWSLALYHPAQYAIAPVRSLELLIAEARPSDQLAEQV